MRKPISTATFKPHSQRLALESRLVFDGAMAATVADVQPDNIDKPITDNTSTAAPAIDPPVNFLPEKAASVVDFQPSADSTTDSPAFFIEPDPLVSGAMTPVMDVKGDNAATPVIVVDPRADNAAALLTNPPANTQILTLDTTRDGFQQVADYLQTRNDVTDLHLLTWTDGNSQWLGNKAVTGTIESTVSNELVLWGDGLTNKANIVFHGADKLSTGWLGYIDALTGGTSSWSQDDITLTPPIPQRSEIVFIESNVTDYQMLLNSVNPNADVYILDASKDGLAQMAQILNGRSGIDAIHIVSHGSTASVGLGSLMLTAQNLSEHNADLAAIGRTLNQSADILLYGCNVGAGSDGEAFIASLAQFTQADIAASIDVTGTADKNGNWVLEARSGTIDSSIAFTDTVADYHDVLGLVNGGATGTVTWGTVATNANVVGAITGMKGGQVISVADNLLTGFDVYAKNNANASATSFTIWNMASTGMTSGTGSYVRIVGTTGYTPQYMDIRANSGVFDLGSIAVGSGDTSSATYNFILQALDSGFNPVGLEVSLTGQAQATFGTINVASNSDFVDIYGVRITVNTGIQIAVDNIAVVNPRASVANTAPTFVQAGAGTLNINENAAATDIKALLHISDTDASQTETWTQSVAPSHGTLNFGSATASSGSADIITAGTITYTPTTGYAGTDTFTIQVSDGTATTTRVINVNVNPLTPSAPDLTIATDTGSSNTDNRTNAALFNFTGASAAGDSTSKVWMFIDTNGNGVQNAGENGTSAVLSNGSWTLNGLSTAGVADGTYNLYAYTTTPANALPSALSSPISITIDKTAPSITNVSIPNVGMKVGDSVTAILTVANDGGDTYTLGSSTIDGFTVSNLIKTNATTYTAQFTVTEGGADIAAASAIPLSLILTDTAGNSNTAYTTVISQATDAINAHTPISMALSTNTILTSAANNAVVGALSSTDATSGDTFTYTLVAGAGSTDNASFNISGGNLQATTPSGLTAGAKSVRVRTTDAGGNFYEQTFSITVSAPANSNPVSSVNTGLTVLEDAAITTITTAMLNVTDAEQAAGALTYTLTTASTKGVFSKSGVALGVGGTFTQADINNGIIKYTPNFNANGSDSVDFSVSDGAGGTLSAQTFNFTITPVVDVNIVAGITPVEGAAGTFTITLDSAPATDLVVNYTLAGTSTLTADYTVTEGTNISSVTTGTFTILAGQTSATLNINALTDVIFDPNETVILKLATGAGYQLAATSATLTITDVNTAPTLGGTFTTAGAVNDNATTTPFSNVTVNDAESNNVSITITYTAANGTLTGAGLTGTAGNYTLTSASLAAVQSNLRALVFTPTANQVVVGATVQTTFTLTPNDGTANGSANATTLITTTSINDAPTSVGNLTLAAVNENTALPAGAAINSLTGFSFTDVDTGASLTGVAVINSGLGNWQYSTNGGTNWYNIGTVTGNSALALTANTSVRFVPVPDFNGTPPSLTVRALDNTYAEGFTNGLTLVLTNASINGGSSGISANTNTIDTRIAAVNDAPVWSGLANVVNFTENGAAVTLGSVITLSDVDLNDLTYANATLTLVRNGNANADDVFANTGTLGALTQGGNLTVNGVVIGTVTSNSAGLLTLTFNANATKALVNSALQQITYSNSSNTPPASVQIMWLFNDNNTGAQGKGAALSAIRSTTVAMTPTNDAPIALNDSATAVNGSTLNGSSLLVNDSDPENDALTVNTKPVTNVAHGALTLYANGSYLYQHDGSAAKTDSFVYEITDGHGGKAQATVTMTISGSPLVQPSSGNVVFLNNLSVFFDNFLTSGSLILLSKCNNYIDSDSRYIFEDKKHKLDHNHHGDYALPPVHLSLYVPLRYHIISVAGILPTQTLIAQEFYVFKIPKRLFQHRNPYETLKFTATNLDGRSLPDWIKLNPKTLTFFGLAPKGAQDVRVMMTIGDQYGNKVHSVFTIHVTDKVPVKNVVGEQRRAVGKSGISEQLYSAAKVSKLQESRRLLDSLNQL